MRIQVSLCGSYAHALESDELIAAKRWDDSLAGIVKLHPLPDVGH
jgi:hypothetical protein